MKSLADRRWSRKLTFFHKIILGRLQTVPSGISKLIQQRKNLLSLIFISKRKQKPFPQELNYLKHLFFQTALKNGLYLASKLEILIQSLNSDLGYLNLTGLEKNRFLKLILLMV